MRWKSARWMITGHQVYTRNRVGVSDNFILSPYLAFLSHSIHHTHTHAHARLRKWIKSLPFPSSCWLEIFTRELMAAISVSVHRWALASLTNTFVAALHISICLSMWPHVICMLFAQSFLHDLSNDLSWDTRTREGKNLLQLHVVQGGPEVMIVNWELSLRKRGFTAEQSIWFVLNLRGLSVPLSLSLSLYLSLSPSLCLSIPLSVAGALCVNVCAKYNKSYNPFTSMSVNPIVFSVAIVCCLDGAPNVQFIFISGYYLQINEKHLCIEYFYM